MYVLMCEYFCICCVDGECDENDCCEVVFVFVDDDYEY